MLTTGAPSWLVILVLILIQVLFGLNYVFAKIVVSAVPPLVWASARIIVASGIMFAVAWAFRKHRHPHPPFSREFFVPLIGFSLLGIIINQGSFLVGLHYTTSTNSSVLNTLIPIFTLLIVTLRGQERATPKRVAGFLAAFAGVLIMRKIEQFTLSDQTWIGDLLTILNCLSYALFLSYSKKFLMDHDRLWTTTWLFLYGSVGLTLIALPAWSHFQMPVLTPVLVGSMIFAIVGGTFLTYFLNIWALSHAKSSSVAIFIYVQPIITALLAWLWLGEIVTLRTVGASLLILLGLVLAL